MAKTKNKKQDKKTKKKEDGILTIGLYGILGISLIMIYIFDGIALAAKLLADAFRFVYNYFRPKLKMGDRNANNRTRD